MITGNRGEWSEIYAFLRLLGEGKLYAGDLNLAKIESIVYPIIEVLRLECGQTLHFSRKERNVHILSENGDTLLRLPAELYLQKSEELLETIRTSRGSFSIPGIEAFMKSIFCTKLKASSSDKTDIRLVLHDPRTRINSELGFSIKSQLGANPTLLNASKATNFIFKVEGNISTEEVSRINNHNPARGKVLERMELIRSLGARMRYCGMESSVFEQNLILLDSDLPKILGCLLLLQSEARSSNLKDLLLVLVEHNPLNYPLSSGLPFYEYKIKHFLTSVALGLMPASPWSGRVDANGGYLIVKEDGDLVCYHIYDRNRFEDYLLHNTFLERSSTERHDYAYLYQQEETLCFKLNLQVRLR